MVQLSIINPQHIFTTFANKKSYFFMRNAPIKAILAQKIGCELYKNEWKKMIKIWKLKKS